MSDRRKDSDDEEQAYHKIAFENWCKENGVSLDNKEDWGPWYECWKAALIAESDYVARDVLIKRRIESN